MLACNLLQWRSGPRRCLVIYRTTHFSMKGYDDERSNKGKIHDGAPIAEKLPRNELGGSGDGGICGTGGKCSREGKHAKGRTRSFLERPGTGEQASSDRKPKLQYSSTDGSWRCRAALVFLRSGQEARRRGWMDTRGDGGRSSLLQGYCRRQHATHCRQLSRDALAHR